MGSSSSWTLVTAWQHSNSSSAAAAVLLPKGCLGWTRLGIERVAFFQQLSQPVHQEAVQLRVVTWGHMAVKIHKRYFHRQPILYVDWPLNRRCSYHARCCDCSLTYAHNPCQSD